jgi:hypothetical protein
MKKNLLLALALASIMPSRAQIPAAPRHLLNKSAKAEWTLPSRDPIMPGITASRSRDAILLEPDETLIGNTYFDLPSNAFIGDRLFLHDDGKLGAVWTLGYNSPDFSDRGTGYNHYNGTSWGSVPSARIETVRTGWPSYAPWNAGGEIVVAHNATNLEICRRAATGSGSWTEFSHTGVAKPTWPKIACSGSSNQYTHVVYHSYESYAGMDGAMIYARTQNGGDTWDPADIILPGTGSLNYLAIQSETYAIASRGNTVAILVGGIWNDMFVMKSSDNGTTWDKIMVWTHPYPFFDFDVTVTDTFFTCDNSACLAIGPDNTVHVAFGISRVLHDAVGTTYYYFPYVDGIGYWNEDMPAFSNHINALAPPQLGYPNSQMVEDYNYIGWMQDMNGNGTLDLVGLLSYRQLGPSSMPSIAVDDGGRIFVAYASCTEGYDDFTYNYKKIWLRAWENGEWGEFYHATDDIIHIFDETIAPILAPGTDDYIHLYYQLDFTIGLALDNDHGYQQNQIIYSRIPKTDLVSLIDMNEVSTYADPPNGGTTTGDGYYTDGEFVTISATPNAYFTFLHWTEADTVVTTSPEYTFTITGDREFTAHFLPFPEYTVTTAVDPPGGGTTSGAGSYPEGYPVTIIAEATSGYVFIHWTEADTVLTDSTHYSFSIYADRSFTAHFLYTDHEVTTAAEPSEGGTTTGDGIYPDGSEVTVNAIPNEGFTFSQWEENDSIVSYEALYSFIITDDRDLVAVFSPVIQYQVTTVADPAEGGNTSGDGVYPEGDTVTVTATEYAGYYFTQWEEGDTLVSLEAEYSFIIHSDRNFTAVFFPLTQFEIIALPDPPEGGTTSGSGMYYKDSLATVTAIPGELWEFVNWTEEEEIVSEEAVYTFTVTAERELFAHFAPIIGMEEAEGVGFLIYPNPFSTSATITVSLPITTQATLEVYTLTGVRIETLHSGWLESDRTYNFQFHGAPYLNQETCIYVIKTDYGVKYGRLMMVR